MYIDHWSTFIHRFTLNMEKRLCRLFFTQCTEVRGLLKYNLAGLCEYVLIVYYFAKNESVASVDNVRWTLAQFQYDEREPFLLKM